MATDSGKQNDDAALGRPICSCRLFSSTTQAWSQKLKEVCMSAMKRFIRENIKVCIWELSREC